MSCNILRNMTRRSTSAGQDQASLSLQILMDRDETIRQTVGFNLLETFSIFRKIQCMKVNVNHGILDRYEVPTINLCR